MAEPRQGSETHSPELLETERDTITADVEWKLMPFPWVKAVFLWAVHLWRLSPGWCLRGVLWLGILGVS